MVNRVEQVQLDFLGRRILMENVSSYVSYNHSSLTEWEFLSAIAEQADCLILLDINNVYVSAVNHEFEPEEYLNGIPAERVCQFHLAEHTDCGDFIIDTHDHPVIDPVWRLYTRALSRFGAVSTMIERDDKFPPFEELMGELNTARRLGSETLGDRQCRV